MKRLTYIIMVLALVLSLTQCKKEQPQPQGEKVYITLKVCGDAKHTVTPGNGMVNYTTGDKIYVGNNGKYIGTLTHNGTAFSGEITDPQTSDYLHFYFIGGCSPFLIIPTSELPDDPSVPKAGVTTSFTVSIADQSSALPVLSYVRTAEKYAGGTSYTCMLENKCGLVKFVPSSPTSASVNLYGFYTTATIDFEHGAITPNAIGNITLYSESNAAKWAILLPQTGVKPTATISGYTCSIEETVDITDNCYNSTGVSIAMTPAYTMAAAATTSDKGKLICTAGHIHAYGEDAACTAGRVAKIIYVGTNGHATYNHGLALALEDMSTKLTWDNSGANNDGKTAAEWCSAWNTSKTVTDAEWLLASKDQWNYMMGTDGAGSYTDLRDGFTSVGGSNMKKGFYWSSTEKDTDNAWNYYFGTGGGWYSSYKNYDGNNVRACLAF